MKNTILIITLLCSGILNAQTTYQEPLLGDKLIEEANKLNKQKDYKGAIDIYNKAHDGDERYFNILAEKATSYYLDSNYTEAIKIADYLIQQTGNTKKSGFMIKAASLSNSGKYDEAIDIYDKVIAINPNDYAPVYEKGIVAYQQKDYEKAMKYFQNTLLINPYYFRAHYNLGVIYQKLGRLSESIIALQCAMLYTSDVDLASMAIRAIEEVSEMSEEVIGFYHNKKEISNDPFNRSDEVIASKIVLNKSYKSGLLIDENLTRQMQVVPANITLDLANDNFVMQYYMPLIMENYNQDYNNFLMYLFSDFNIKSIQKYANKRSNRNSFKNLKNRIDLYCDDIYGTRILNYEQRTAAPKQYLYLPSDNIYIVGKAYWNYQIQEITYNDDAYTIYYNGVLVSEGRYQGGKKDGEWKMDDKNTGKVSSIEQYKKGEIQNVKKYYSNGNLSTEEKYENGKLSSFQKNNLAGLLSSTKKYKSSTESYFETYYYPNGKIVRDYNIDNDRFSDKADTIFYNSGKPLRVLPFSNGNIDGWLFEYFESGALKEKRFYKKGTIDGIETCYWENGKILSEIEYLDGSRHGVLKYYAENGTLIRTDNYKKGLADGWEVEYNLETGKKTSEILYKDDKLFAYKYYDKNGNIIAEAKEGNAPLKDVKQFDEYGTLIYEATVNDKGVFVDQIKSYYGSGNKLAISDLKGGDIDGKTMKYDNNGIIDEDISMKEGERNGLYTKYYDNGKPYYKGYYVSDTLQGVWEYYNDDGSLFRKAFFLDDILNGTDAYYYPNGNLKEEIKYKYGNMAGFAYYDKEGNLIDSIQLPKLNGKVNLKYTNNKPFYEFTITNGKYEGDFKMYYPNNQLMTIKKYEFGNQIGKEIQYFPNGAKRFEGTFKNDRLDGSIYYFNSNGDTTEVYPYVNGETDGKAIKYINGSKRYEMTYKKNNLNGSYTYYANGKVAVILYYDNDLLVGYSYYDKNNQLVPTINLNKGTGDIVAYYPNGKKSFEAKRVSNSYEGKVVLYFENGILAEERNFINGNYEGATKYYNIEGKLIHLINYKNDELHGSREVYNNAGTLIQKEMFNMGVKDGESIYKDKK